MLRSPGLLGQAEGTLETRFFRPYHGTWWGARQGKPMWQTQGDRGLKVSQCQGPKGGRTCTTWATLGGRSEADTSHVEPWRLGKAGGRGGDDIVAQTLASAPAPPAEA